MYYLVTGGTGLLGSSLLYQLASKNVPIIALKRNGSDLKRVESIFCRYNPQNGKELFSKIKWETADIKDSIALEGILEKGVKQVYHAAGLVSFNPSHRKRLIKTNHIATKQLVDLCLHYKVEKFAYVSSVATLSKPESKTYIDESCLLDSDDAIYYGKSKFLGEKEVWRGTAEGMPAIIVKPGIILASGFRGESSGAILDQALKLKFATKGSVGFIDVEDVAKSIVHLMSSQVENEDFILVSETTTYDTFFNLVKTKANKPKVKIMPNTILNIICKLSTFVGMINPSWDFFSKGLKDSLTDRFTYDNSKVKDAIPFNLLSLEDSLDKHLPNYLNGR